MKIALVVHDARPGGGQDRYVLELANGLAANHHVTLVAASAEGLSDAVHWQRVRVPQRPWILRATLFSSKARRIVRAESWDIVHTIGAAMPGATVITAQFCQAAWAAVQRKAPLSLMGPVERIYRDMNTGIAERSERRAARNKHLRALIAVSKRTASEWQTWYGLATTDVTVIPNGVDAARFTPSAATDRGTIRSELGIADSARILLTVGALLRKGIETSLRALKQLPEDVHLVAIGAGSHERIRSLANKLNVSRRFHLMHPVGDIERYFRAADVFLFPTRYEPFGMVIAEAWASGVPVVASACSGATEWATHEQHAMIVRDALNAEAFAHDVTRVLTDGELANRLKINGIELASQFAWKRVVQDTAHVFERASSEATKNSP